MQSRNRFFDDAAKVAEEAIGTLAGVRREVESLVRQQSERMLSSMDLVTRDEFNALKEMAAKARTEQEDLLERVAALEAALSDITRAPKTRPTPVPETDGEAG